MEAVKQKGQLEALRHPVKTQVILTVSKSANDLFLQAWATLFIASVWMDNNKII